MKEFINAAVLGFVVAVLAIFSLFFFWNVPDGSGLAAAIRTIIAIVCPPLVTPLAYSAWGMAAVPFLNAGLYVAIFLVIRKLRSKK